MARCTWPAEILINKDSANSFLCNKCKLLPTICMSNNNGEMLCKECASNVQEFSIVQMNKVVQRMVNKLKTKCLTTENNSEEGIYLSLKSISSMCQDICIIDQCDWVGTIAEYEQHIETCPYVMIRCTECDSFQCRRKDMDKHLLECPEQRIECPLKCGSLILRKNKDIHIENVCCEKLMDCLNEECKKKIKRKNMENHIKNQCSYRVVECEFKCFGCNVYNIKANQLKKHYMDYRFDHLQLKLDYVINEFGNKINAQNSLIAVQQQSINVLKMQLKAKEIEMKKLNKYVGIGEQWQNNVVHNFDTKKLTQNGWKCVYEKPYSHKTTTLELRSLCEDSKDIQVFVGGIDAKNKCNVLLGAFGPSSVLHRLTNSRSIALKPTEVKNKNEYNVYWYHFVGASFGFSSEPTISHSSNNPADRAMSNPDDRLSWLLNESGGWRLGERKKLSKSNAYLKVIYIHQK